MRRFPQACLLVLIWVAFTASGQVIYNDDPAVIAALKALGDRSATILAPINVECGDLTLHGVNQFGPGNRDYCNKMVYAPERQTALFAGGNHQVPHRMNDAWEYHLGSNTWHLKFAPDGGDPSKHKGAYFLTSRELVRKPDMPLTEKQQADLAAYKAWWAANVVFKQGHLSTTRGGPIMPAHTWDGVCYDARAKKMLWGQGAVGAAQLTTHAYFTGVPLARLEAQADESYTPMWLFDPAKEQWSRYRTDRPRASLRGMGASLTYLPDLGKSLWYVAAENVSPPAYEMWLFDAVVDAWTELKPNGGMGISELVRKQGVAPGSELQCAYSVKHRKLIAVLKHDTFVYDVEKDLWSKVLTDDRVYAHDAHSVFAYDEHADVFLLMFPPNGKGKGLSMAAYSLQKNAWELINIAGPGFPQAKYGSAHGYYDPIHNVFMLQGRYRDQVWVYRHQR
jgi:hypothetical protein